MKKTIIAIAASMAFGNVLAEDSSMPSFCESVNDIATSTMKARQDGIPMIVPMGFIEKHDDPATKSLNEQTKRMIIDAYGTPKFNTPKYQQEAINEFSSQEYRKCLLDTMK